MKFKKTLKWRETFLILAVITVILALLRGPERKKEREILGNPGFVIGEVIHYTPSKARGSTNDAIYVYYVNNVKYEEYISSLDYPVPNKDVSVGDFFLVIFEKNNPSNSVMLFDYRIRDSLDINDAIEAFKKRKYKRLMKPLWGVFNKW